MAAASGVDRLIRFGRRITHVAWTMDTVTDVAPERYTCGFLFLRRGYYHTAVGSSPDWPGVSEFAGRVIHLQQWPADVDYARKPVVFMGSGPRP